MLGWCLVNTLYYILHDFTTIYSHPTTRTKCPLHSSNKIVCHRKLLGLASRVPGNGRVTFSYHGGDYVFESVPACLAGGIYIGTRTWPKAGTWTIEYEAPTMLYVTCF